MQQRMTQVKAGALNPFEFIYTRAVLLSYQALLSADYLNTHPIEEGTPQQLRSDDKVTKLLPGFVTAGKKLPPLFNSLDAQLGDQKERIDQIITEGFERTLSKHQGPDHPPSWKYRTIRPGASLKETVNTLSTSPLMLKSARILQTVTADDPGNSGGGGGGVEVGGGGNGGDEPGSGGGNSGDTSSSDPALDTGTPYQNYPPDVQQQTAKAWSMGIKGRSAEAQGYIEKTVNQIQSGEDIDIDAVNATITGIVAGVAASAGGIVGAALAALALILIPRMLTAIEDAVGDYLVGDLPGF